VGKKGPGRIENKKGNNGRATRCNPRQAKKLKKEINRILQSRAPLKQNTWKKQFGPRNEGNPRGKRVEKPSAVPRRERKKMRRILRAPLKLQLPQYIRRGEKDKLAPRTKGPVEVGYVEVIKSGYAEREKEEN